jgi:predicted nucleotidyltransferase component of viral defense system
MNLKSEAERLIKTRYSGAMNMLPVVMKALIHDSVLPALQESGILKKLVFQGGTALQRFYNSQRFSEDLDFVCGQGTSLKLTPEEFKALGPAFENSVRTALAKKFSLDVDSVILKHPNDLSALRGQDVKVQVWQLKVPIAPGSARQMVKVEVANVPSYQSEPKIWPEMLSPGANHEPSRTVLIEVESRAEIMADKVVALACRNFIKQRDIWDYHILKSQGIAEDMRIVQKKFKDYGISPESLHANLESKIAALKDTSRARQEFWTEMERFVFPGTVGHLKEAGMDSDMIASVSAVLRKTKRVVERDLDSGLEL